MKKLCILNILAAALFALASARAASVEEIDLAGGDDSAIDRASAPRVERTDDGYIDVICDDATIASVLQQFRRCTKMNILCGESTNLNRRVSATLTHVPWCTALQSILELASFKMDERNGIWYVSEKTNEEVKNATRYFVLKHASCVDLADLFNGVAMKTSYNERNSIRGQQNVMPGQTPAGATAGGDDLRSAIAGRAKASAYPNTNMLVLNGPEANILECERIIRQLDRPVTQVYIEARFIELSNEAMHKLGIQWNDLESWGMSAKQLKAGYERNDGTAADYGEVMNTRTSNSTTTKSTTSSTTGSKSTSLSGENDSTANVSESTNDNLNDNENSNDSGNYTGLVPKEIAEAAGAGASAASMGWKNASTFSGQLSADDFRLALSAFEKLEEGKMFSNPRIIVANGKEARVDMTTKEPNVEVTSDRTGSDGQYLSVSTKLETIPGQDRNLFAGEAFFSYGITLSVKPRVSSTGLISVEVVPTISEKKEDKKIAGTDANSVYTTYPVINIKSINTEFTMKDGSTAVIGGLTQTSEQDVDSGIPYLRKIPWIGPKLFGWQSRMKVQNEILVCVTVGIANPETLQKDAGLPTNAVLGREYVEGRRLEPGLRPNAVKDISTVDTRTLDRIREEPYRYKDEAVDLENEAKPETKSETKPAAETKPVAKAEPTPEAKPAAQSEPDPVVIIRSEEKAAAAAPVVEPAKSETSNDADDFGEGGEAPAAVAPAIAPLPVQAIPAEAEQAEAEPIMIEIAPAVQSSGSRRRRRR